jgi:lipoprotein LpqB-like beta-propeller protein/sporulation and spore germination protein
MKRLWSLTLVLLVVLSGCATVPTGGRVDSGRSAQRNEQIDDPYVRIVPAPPGRDWSHDLIVRGFLVASASFDDQHRVARQYLTPQASAAWQPDGRPRVIVRAEGDGGDPLMPTTVHSGDHKADVEVKYVKLGEIGVDGQYTASPESSIRTQFGLVRDGRGQWRINALPDELETGLLLSRRDVQRAFRILNLYFFEPDGKVLVPNGVFLPLVNRQDLARQLVQALLDGPTSWLRPAVKTNFPKKTRLLGGVDITEDLATVNLSAEAFNGSLAGMSAQLTWTLARLEEIKRVKLMIDGKPIEAGDAGPIQSASDWKVHNADTPVHDAPGPETAFLRGTDDHLYRLYHDKTEPVTALGDTRLRQPSVSLPSAELVAGLNRERNAVLTGNLSGTSEPTEVLRSREPGGRFTTPTWDRRNTLWTVESARGRSWLWALPQGRDPERLERWELGSREVVALRIARDGVRAAAVVRNDKDRELRLGRIERLSDGELTVGAFLPVSSELVDVSDLAWAESTALAVLGKTKTVGAQLTAYRVPVSGEAITPIGSGALGDPVSIAAAPGSPVLVAAKTKTKSNICYQVPPREWFSQWECKASGSEPTYPG